MNPLAPDLEHILIHTRDLWDNLRGERLFLTGGTGFFGCWLLESFLWANEKLKLNASATVLTRRPQAFIDKVPHLALGKGITLVEGDIQSFPFPAGTFSHMIHAATEASAKLNTENPLSMLDTIVLGTRRALEFSSVSRTKNFLLTSSGAIYGAQPPDLTHISEEYPGAPDPLDIKSAYGQGKRMAEHMCAQYARLDGLQPKIARCFAFVGPYLPLNTHFAIGNFIRDGLMGGPIVIQGDGTPRRSYLYASDLTIWLWTILFNGQAMRPYNVGSDESLSIEEVAHRVAKQISPKLMVEIRGTSSAIKHLDRYVPNINRIKDELNLQIDFDVNEGIKRTINGYRG